MIVRMNLDETIQTINIWNDDHKIGLTFGNNAKRGACWHGYNLLVKVEIVSPKLTRITTELINKIKPSASKDELEKRQPEPSNLLWKKLRPMIETYFAIVHPTDPDYPAGEHGLLASRLTPYDYYDYSDDLQGHPETRTVAQAIADCLESMGGVEPAITKSIVLQREKPGRKTDPLYDEAYRMISNREKDELETFNWFCEQADILKPDKNVRDSFKAALKRRQNKT